MTLPTNELETPYGHTYRTDLNLIDTEEGRRKDIPAYDVVLMAEVFEHLYQSPQSIFRYLASLTKPGGTLIIQTPNGIRINRRLALLLGRHPYPPLSDDQKFASHVREYTRRELIEFARGAGFEVETCIMAQYFDMAYLGHTGKKAGFLRQKVVEPLMSILPQDWRRERRAHRTSGRARRRP